MKAQSVDTAAIEAEIDHIRSLGIDDLRSRWRLMFRKSPPRALTKDLLARMIAYRIQEEAFGGLDRATIKLLDSLARGQRPGSDLPRRLKAGTVLVREYRGKRHTVTVVPNGFLWRESLYPSLSTIAKTITGMTWNGPRFFGLRGTPALVVEVGEAALKASSEAPIRRGRSKVRASLSNVRRS